MNAPRHLDLVIVHQFDAARPSPGGIDTCIRGIATYREDVTVGIVGVDAGSNRDRRLGQWEQHSFGERTVHFLPVARLDPADQNRRIPHSARLIAGFIRYRRAIPAFETHQAHRADTAGALRVLLHRPGNYFIHTQENGLTGADSDSWWRRAGTLHHRMERWVARRSSRVVVFNLSFAAVVETWNPNTIASATWFDPALVHSAQVDPDSVIWVGRVEHPKDPLLAIETMSRLWQSGDTSRRLTLVGTGTLLPEVQRAVRALPEALQDRIELAGRLGPGEVADRMARAGAFLMTSRDGYEGFPRVLVEAMAHGAVPVVTAGSDTGGLVDNAVTGFRCTRDADELARALSAVGTISRDRVSAAVADLAAPAVIERIYRGLT